MFQSENDFNNSSNFIEQKEFNYREFAEMYAVEEAIDFRQYVEEKESTMKEAGGIESFDSIDNDLDQLELLLNETGKLTENTSKVDLDQLIENMSTESSNPEAASTAALLKSIKAILKVFAKVRWVLVAISRIRFIPRRWRRRIRRAIRSMDEAVRYVKM